MCAAFALSFKSTNTAFLDATQEMGCGFQNISAAAPKSFMTSWCQLICHNVCDTTRYRGGGPIQSIHGLKDNHIDLLRPLVHQLNSTRCGIDASIFNGGLQTYFFLLAKEKVDCTSGPTNITRVILQSI